MQVNCNTGTVKINQKGKYGKLAVLYMLEGVANILSMNKLETQYHITYPSWEGHYVVHTGNGPVHFCKDKQGLPYINLTTSDDKAATMLVQTVRNNFEGFTKKEVKTAKTVRGLQGMIGSPSKKDFGGMVSNTMIKNCPIVPSDITTARTIFGPDLAGIRKKNSEEDARSGNR